MKRVSTPLLQETEKLLKENKMPKITEQGITYEIEYGNDNVRNVMLRHIEQLERQLAAERERADSAWQNTRIIEKARQEEMRKRDDAQALVEHLAKQIRGQL